MALRAEGTNILIKLDDNSLDAYILDALIERERFVAKNIPGSHIHYDQITKQIKKRHPNLEINTDTVVDRLHALTEKGIITSTPAHGDPSYRFNPEYLKEQKKLNP